MTFVQASFIMLGLPKPFEQRLYAILMKDAMKF